MARPLMDRVLTDARVIIADRRRRLCFSEAVTKNGLSCDPCIVAAYDLTGDHERAHRLGWKDAGMIAEASHVRRRGRVAANKVG